MIDNIIEFFPRITPSGTIRVEDEEHTFSTNASSNPYTYQLGKAPVERVSGVAGVVDGRSYTFVEGTDYQVVDDNGDGNIDSIDFDVGGEMPDEDSTFSVTYVAESVISRYTAAHDDVVGDTLADIETVIDSHQIDNAVGDDLDQIGSLFGDLGKRRGRNDNEYRIFLRSIVQSFNGRGTKPGIRFAVSSGLGVGGGDISIEEDFTNVEYTIVLENWSSHTGSVIERLAELADPSGVELLQTKYVVDPEEVSMSDSVSISEGIQIVGDEMGGSDDAFVDPNRREVVDVGGVDDTAIVDGNHITETDEMVADDTVVPGGNNIVIDEDAGLDDAVTTTIRIVAWDNENWDTMYWAR